MTTLSDEFIDLNRMYNAVSIEISMTEMHPDFWKNESKELEVTEKESVLTFNGKQLFIKLSERNIVIKTKQYQLILWS